MRERIISDLKKTLKPSRFEHVLRVEDMACRLAADHHMDVEQARLAALLHDAAKGHSEQEYLQLAQQYGLQLDEFTKSSPKLLHAPLAACIAERSYGISDSDILSAIAYHTTLRPGASELEQVIYLSDMVEDGRNFEGAEELRELAFTDFDQSLLLALKDCIGQVLKKGYLLHPDSVGAYNEMVKRIKDRETIN